MNAIRVKTLVQADGELHLSNLPCHKGECIETIVFLPENSDQDKRKAARQRFLNLARRSKFRSDGKYPDRNKLHERT